MGCCTSNACANASGCPQANLIQGILSEVTSAAEKMDPHPPLPGNNDGTNSNSSGSSLSTEIIAGIAIGTCAILIVIIMVLWWHRRRRDKGTIAAQACGTTYPPDPHEHEKNKHGRRGQTGRLLDVPDSEHYHTSTPSPIPIGFPPPTNLSPQQLIVHEADSGGPRHADHSHSLAPMPPHAHEHQEHSVRISTCSMSMPSPVSTLPSYNISSMPPQELAGDCAPIRDPGSSGLSPIDQHAAETDHDREFSPTAKESRTIDGLCRPGDDHRSR